jgi:SAM-dependent methyltransferase
MKHIRSLAGTLKRALVRSVPHSVRYRLHRRRQRRLTTAPDYTHHALDNSQQPLDPQDPLSVEFHRRGPWLTQFAIHERFYGGTHPYDRDPRIVDYFEWIRPRGTVLELGSFEGGHSLRIAQRPEVTSLLGLEGREFLIARAEFVARTFGIQKVSFRLCDFEVDRLSTFGHFDSVFCSGVLYHLSRPWRLLREISRVTEHVFLNTHFAIRGVERLAGYEGQRRAEYGYEEPLSGLHTYSFWLTLDSLRVALRRAGLEIVHERFLDHPLGWPWVSLYARTVRASSSRQRSST